MKPLSILLVLSLLLFFPASVSAAAETGKGGTVTLTSDQVISAIEIENAFHAATAEGTRPGVIILDGSNGPFVLSGPDDSVNMIFSNITLRGTNNAVLVGCGIYIDGSPADNLVIENLAINSRCDGISSNGMVHRKVIIRNNLVRADGSGIGGANNVDWVINNNVVVARLDGIFLYNGQHTVVLANQVSSGALNVYLSGTQEALVMNNVVAHGWQGVLINAGASQNRVLQNIILGVQQSGVALEAGVQGNTIQGNRVVCALEAVCLTVDAGPAEREANHIAKNRP